MEGLARTPSASKRVYQQTFSPDAYGEPEVLMSPAVRHKPRACSECRATSTPQWRQGPAGPQTLCNACGVRYSRLMRKGSKSHRRKATLQHQDDFSEDSVSDDTSKGTTILLMPSPTGVNMSNSPTQATHPFQVASLTPFIHEGPPPLVAISRTRRRSYGPTITTSTLPSYGPSMEPVLSAPLLPPVSTQLRHRQEDSSGLLRLGSTSTVITNLPGLSATVSTGVQPATAQLQPREEDHEVDCEAALNLLSMAAGQAAPAPAPRDSAVISVGVAPFKQEEEVKPAVCPPPLFTTARAQLTSSCGSGAGQLNTAVGAATLALPVTSPQHPTSVQQLLANAVAGPAAAAAQRADSMHALLARMMLCPDPNTNPSPAPTPYSAYPAPHPSPTPSNEEHASHASPSSSGSAPSASSSSDPTSGLDGMQALMSRLSAEEQQSLQQLCNRFDACFQEMVAAQAACEAVSQILRSKQEAARAAQLAARSAAQLLLVKATQLSAHRSMLQAAAAVPQIAAVLNAADTATDQAAQQQQSLHAA